MRRRRSMLGRIIVIAVIAIIVGVVIEHSSGLTKGIVRLLGFSGQSIEEVEQEAKEAGNEAAEERRNELDQLHRQPGIHAYEHQRTVTYQP